MLARLVSQIDIDPETGAANSTVILEATVPLTYLAPAVGFTEASDSQQDPGQQQQLYHFTGLDPMYLNRSVPQVPTYALQIGSSFLAQSSGPTDGTSGSSAVAAGGEALPSGVRRVYQGPSLDSEEMVKAPNGRLYVADEYGPSVYEFTEDGVFMRAFELAPNLVRRDAGLLGTSGNTTSAGTRVSTSSSSNSTNPVGFSAFKGTGASRQVSGRQDNKGFESLAISPDGTKLYAMLQVRVCQSGILRTSHMKQPAAC